MSTVVTALVGPNSYNLSDGTISWRILDDGLAMPGFHRLEERGPLQNGTTDVGFRLDPRVLHLTLKTQGTSIGDLYNRRKALINIFKPLANLPISLRYTLDNGDVRQIDCNLSDFKMDEKDREGFMQTAQVTLRANEPTWYDPTPRAVTFTSAYYGVNPYFPLSISSGSFGAISFTPSVNVFNSIIPVTYGGNVPVNPVITLTGPITNPTIYNYLTGEKLSFEGYKIPTGQTWTIDTRYGYKTVTDGNGVNQLGKLSYDSNLASFHLEVDPILANGLNLLAVNGSDLSAQVAFSSGSYSGTTTVYAQAQISYFNRYIGL